MVNRNHKVTAIARNIDELSAYPGIDAKRADVANFEAMTALLRGKDAVISAVRFFATDLHSLIRSVKKAGVPRLLVMGGAASLRLADGTKLIDDPAFPREYEPEARAAMSFLDVLKKEQELDWTFLSPAAVIENGERTGTFRTGGDDLLVDEAGVSRITFEDYAIAIVGELERPRHTRRRFTVAY